jgi:hypothetical protein
LKIIDVAYNPSTLKPKIGQYSMVIGLLMLLFIGFNRIWHFSWMCLDAMLSGYFKFTRLQGARVFWRFVDSLGIKQAHVPLRLMALLCNRVWQLCNITYYRIFLDIDKTVKTVFGKQQGAQKGHNPSNRRKKGYRLAVSFTEQSCEYLLDKLRRGKTISGKQTEAFIARTKRYIPRGVRQVQIREDAEFQSWHSIPECLKAGYNLIITNKKCVAPFYLKSWYPPHRRRTYKINSCVYQPMGRRQPVRFVGMRIPKQDKVFYYFISSASLMTEGLPWPWQWWSN